MAVYENGELVLYGFVGENYWDEGFTAREVISALAEHGRDNDLTVRINSGGGYTDDGVSIYNALTAHRGHVRVEVDGVALSAASLITMAGDDIIMKAGSLMMIHDPAAITIGDAQDHETTIGRLNKLGDVMASIYAERSGKSADDVRVAMKDELWMTADEAVEQGYATEAETAKAKPVAAFDYRIYAHAPQRLRTLAGKKNWSLPEADTSADRSAPPRQPKEPSMATDTTTTGLTPADIDKAKAEASAEATKTTAATAADIVDLCNTAGVPTMAATLIREGATMEQAKARTTSAGEIRARVDAARKMQPKIEANAADTFIAAGLSPAQASERLLEQITALQSPEITSAHQSSTGEVDEAKAEAAKVVAAFGATVNTKKGSAA
jgi:ATP-dependent Clp protease, protease subunit